MESYYDPAGNTVEPVTDSSRYFVLKVLDPSSGTTNTIEPYKAWLSDIDRSSCVSWTWIP